MRGGAACRRLAAFGGRRLRALRRWLLSAGTSWRRAGGRTECRPSGADRLRGRRGRWNGCCNGYRNGWLPHGRRRLR